MQFYLLLYLLFNTDEGWRGNPCGSGGDRCGSGMTGAGRGRRCGWKGRRNKEVVKTKPFFFFSRILSPFLYKVRHHFVDFWIRVLSSHSTHGRCTVRNFFLHSGRLYCLGLDAWTKSRTKSSETLESRRSCGPPSSQRGTRKSRRSKTAFRESRTSSSNSAETAQSLRTSRSRFRSLQAWPVRTQQEDSWLTVWQTYQSLPYCLWDQYVRHQWGEGEEGPRTTYHEGTWDLRSRIPRPRWARPGTVHSPSLYGMKTVFRQFRSHSPRVKTGDDLPLVSWCLPPR